MYPRVTSETEYLTLFHSISQLTHPLGRSVYQTINPSSGSQICTQFEGNSTQASIQKSTVCGNSFGLPALWRCDIMPHWQTHLFHSKTANTIRAQPFVRFSLYWEFNSWFHWKESELFLSAVKPSMAVVSLQSAQMNVTVYAPCPCCVRTKFAGAPLLLAKEQSSTRCSPSFWMNDLRSQLPGSLHQTWPTLIINDSGGQCPIFMAESSVMPGQTKPPEFHHFQLLLTPKQPKKTLHQFNNVYGMPWKPKCIKESKSNAFCLSGSTWS